MVNALPPGQHYSADGLIDDHTTFPFYAPFLTAARANQVRRLLRGNRKNHIHRILGVSTNCVGLPSQLRYCPTCVEEDRKKFGETYWHHIHQISKIDACPRHAVFLEQSDVLWRIGYRQFISAERAVNVTVPQKLDTSNTQHSILLRLAREVEWLLRWRGTPLGMEVLLDRYYSLFQERGFASYNGPVRVAKLIRDFEAFYSPELLARLGCQVTNRESCWLRRIYVKGRVSIIQFPLRHLLLMMFLGQTSEQVFTAFREYKPFGDGPWPCLNRISAHYGEPRITSCQITRSNSFPKRGNPFGVFGCNCGFTYVRTGPDETTADRLRIGKVQEYGHVWEEALRRRWSDPTVTIEQKAKEFGVEPSTLERQAVRLGLTSSGSRRMPRQSVSQQLPTRRREWLAVLEAHPGANRVQLYSVASGLCQWMARYDGEWFDAHLPPALTYRGGRPVHVDWKKADAEFSTAIAAAATRLRSLHGRPVRVSQPAIIKQTGHRHWIDRYLDRLPLTAEALSRHVESREDFALRGIRWAEDYFRQEGKCPTRYMFERVSRTQFMIGTVPAVRGAIDAAMSRLQERFGSEGIRRSINSLTKVA